MAHLLCLITILITPSGPRTRSRTMLLDAGRVAIVRDPPPADASVLDVCRIESTIGVVF
jgi:hypothetical protein